MNKLILTTSILIVAVFTVAYLYFSSLSSGSRNNDKALSQITNDAALIFQFKNDKSIYDIFSDYSVFDAIIGRTKQEEITALKSVLFGSKAVFRNTLGQDIYLSFHPLKTDSIAFLWIMALPQNIDDSEVIEALKQNQDIQYKESKQDDHLISEVYIERIKRTFYVHADKNIVSGSFSLTAMKNSLNEETEKISKSLIEEINRASQQNQNSPASVFVNFGNSIPFLSSFFKNKLNGNFSLLNNFNAIATLNMNFKSDALMFNGITETDTTQLNYINLFLNQKAIKNPIKRIVPDNTANFILYGVSDYPLFHQDLKRLFSLRKELDKINTTVGLVRNESGIDPDRDIKKYWGDEFITFQLSTQERFAAIKLTNGRQMQFFMEPISSEYSENIRRLNYSGILYYYFGDAFKHFNKPFFTIIDNQMIVSNSPTSIQRYLTRYSRDLLFADEKFITFDQLVADRSNISVFIHIKNSGSNISSQLKPAYASIFRGGEYHLKNFYGISYQWTSESDHFFTNFYAGYKQGHVPIEVSKGPDSLN